MTKSVEAWAVVGSWDKGIYWWYDENDLNQFQLFRTKHMAIRARNEWRNNGYRDARVEKVTIGLGDGDER